MAASFTTDIQHYTGSATQSNSARKEKKKHTIRKEKRNLSLHADNIILYVEHFIKHKDKNLLVLKMSVKLQNT